MTVMAAFQTLLYRYTGQEKILVGSPIANRDRTEVEGLIGFFVNTLVIRSDISGELSFRQLLGRVREVALEAYAHQNLPFEKLVEELQPERDLSRSPLIQVMFALQNTPMMPLELAGLRVSPLALEYDAAKFDLTLYLWEIEDGIEGSIEYATDLFDSVRIARMIGHYQTLLESITANPDQSISKLPLLTPREQHQLLTNWISTKVEYPEDRCIHELFEEQVGRTPDAIAVLLGEQMVTFEELNRRANILAHHLHSLGVEPEVLVGIYTERSIETVVGLLGIMKAGGAYVPFDPTHPKDRLSYMLQDSGIPVLLTQKRLLEALPEHGAKVMCLDSDWKCISKERDKNFDRGALADNLAYVMYTSGSTGKPKGVLGLHRGPINRFHWMWQRYPFADDEVCCQKTALGFVDSVWEIFGPLLQGKSIVIIPDEVLKDTKRFIQMLARYQVSRIVLVPSLAVKPYLLNWPTNLPRPCRIAPWSTSMARPKCRPIPLVTKSGQASR
jgi:non-ribosomal peptide synthetase component F